MSSYIWKKKWKMSVKLLVLFNQQSKTPKILYEIKFRQKRFFYFQCRTQLTFQLLVLSVISSQTSASHFFWPACKNFEQIVFQVWNLKAFTSSFSPLCCQDLVFSEPNSCLHSRLISDIKDALFYFMYFHLLWADPAFWPPRSSGNQNAWIDKVSQEL